MTEFLGVSIGVFIFGVVIAMGFAAYMTGQAIAVTWRPAWQVFVYSALLGLASRFLVLALFYHDPIFHFGEWMYGAVIDFVVMLAIAFAAYRITLARVMVDQYPWSYERAGLFSYRQKTATDSGSGG